MGPEFTNLYNKLASQIVYPLIALLFAVALIIFLWGVMVFIKNADSEEERDKGKKHMIWGIIGMAIMASAPAIVSIIDGTIKSL